MVLTRDEELPQTTKKTGSTKANKRSKATTAREKSTSLKKNYSTDELNNSIAKGKMLDDFLTIPTAMRTDLKEDDLKEDDLKEDEVVFMSMSSPEDNFDLGEVT